MMKTLLCLRKKKKKKRQEPGAAYLNYESRNEGMLFLFLSVVLMRLRA